MAKGKGKQTTGANSVAVKNRPIDNAPKPGADALPPMEESAFAGLRQKIEQRLKDGAAKQKPKNNKSKSAPAGDSNKAKDNSTKTSSNQPNLDKNVKGKKRDRNGEVIAQDEKEDGKSQKSKSDKTGGDDTLRQEILALGGTEEDLELLAGVDSESEVEDAKTSKKPQGSSEDLLRKELSSMLAAAGQVVPEDLADDDVEGEEVDEEEQDGEEEEIEEDGEEEDEPVDEEDSAADSLSEEVLTPEAKQPTKKETKETVPETIFPKEFSKLVSGVASIVGAAY